MLLRIVLTSLLLWVVVLCFAQTKAVTENGDEVVLYDDGTWKSIDSSTSEEFIKTNPATFTKGKRSSFLLKSSKFNVGFWIDPKKWKFEKASKNDAAEFELHLKDGDLYGMIIAEKMQIPLETLKNIAIDNGRIAAPDLSIQNEEYRTVNGLKVLHLQMAGTMQGIRFFYYGYYFSNPSGTVQFVTYSAQNLLPTYQTEIEELLNGLVEL
ncbi:MAG TPA: hypothetical protein VK589_19915 [Chryseolinea sp.]|nr:hypothetical protein [Chryseolinea sp.]